MGAKDTALTAAAAQGNAQARKELVLRLMSRVRTTAMYLVHSRSDADDITQQVLIEVLRSAATFRGDSSLESWADRITTRVAFHTIRRGRAVASREESVEVVPEYPEWSKAVSSTADTLAARKMLAALLAKLPAVRRETLILKHVLGYSIEEIAEQTKTNVNTVRDRLSVARAQLRAWLSGDPHP